MIRHAWVVPVCLALAGCAAFQRVGPPSGAAVTSETTVPSGPPPSLKIGFPGPRSLKGTVVVSLEQEGQGRRTIEGYLEAARPDRLRLTTHLGFIQAFELTSRGDSFWVVVPHEDVILAGRKSDIHPTPMDPSRLAQALFLRPVESESLEVASQQRDTAGVWLEGRDALGPYRLRLDVHDRPIAFTRPMPGGGTRLRIDFERYVAVHGGWYPRRIRWSDPPRNQSLTLEFDEVRLDGEPDPRRFEPRRDASLRVIEWVSWTEMFESPR